MVFNEINEFRRSVIESNAMIRNTVTSENDAALRLTQLRRDLNEGVQDCLQIEGRLTNSFEHIGSSGLLSKCFAQLAAKPGDLLILAGCEGMVAGNRPLAALRRCLAASRFRCLAAW